jgi:hypothetical protein
MTSFHPLQYWLLLVLLCGLSAKAQAYDARGNLTAETRPGVITINAGGGEQNAELCL